MDKNKIVYWGFQSSQAFEPSEQDLKSFQRKYKKDFETRELYEGQELEDYFRLSAWRNPRYSKITSIILGYEHQGILRVKYIEGEEKDVLQTFVNILKNDLGNYTLAHFDSQIVLPYIGIRLKRNGWLKEPHKDLKYSDPIKMIKHWDLTGIDLKQVYDGAGRYRSSIEDIADDLGLSHEGIINYDDEFTYYNSGNFEALKTSAIRKVEVLANIHRSLLELPQIEAVLIEERVANVEEQKPTNWLEALYRENTFTDQIKKGLREQIKGNKILVRDKKNLMTILRGVYIHCNFEQKDQDYGDVIKSKELEVEEFINTL